MMPLFTKVFVEPITETQQSTSNLDIPVTNFLKGKVICRGKLCAEEITEGATVLYEKGTGNQFTYDGIEGLFFEEKQLICIL